MMRIKSLVLVLFGVLSSSSFGCVTPSSTTTEAIAAPLLNSERIKQKFGSYGVRVLESTSPLQRIAILYSVHDGEQVCRTLAITEFEEPLNPSLREGHRLIVEENQSIGSTFKELGWTISKENLYFGTIEPDSLCLSKLMGIATSQPLALHIYRLSLSKDELKNLLYSIIAEIHHPGYLSLDELHSIYGQLPGDGDIEKLRLLAKATIDNLKC